jgi:hypothetical protein
MRGQFVSHGVDGGGELLVHVSAEVTDVVNDYQATGHHRPGGSSPTVTSTSALGREDFDG